MKKTLLGIAALALLFTSCNDDQETVSNNEQSKIDMSDFYVYTDADIDEPMRIAEGKSKACYTMVNLNRQLNEDPTLEKKMYDIEYNTRKFSAAKKPDGAGNGNGNGNDGGGDDGTGGGDNLGVINIPVYVHVVYSNSQQNISDAQINSQITVLNKDFRATNNDLNQVPSEFSGVTADSEITFSLAGTFRHSNSRSSW